MARDDERHGEGRGWHRDERGRKYRVEAEARFYENQADRDAALEERYRLWCNTDPEAPCCRSLLQHVMTHAEGLLAQYMQWIRDQHHEHSFETEHLARWEVERFGDRAYPAAHAALLFVVKCAVFGSPYKNLRGSGAEPKRKAGLSDEDRHRQMLIAAHTLAEKKTMPELGRIR